MTLGPRPRLMLNLQLRRCVTGLLATLSLSTLLVLRSLDIALSVFIVLLDQNFRSMLFLRRYTLSGTGLCISTRSTR